MPPAGRCAAPPGRDFISPCLAASDESLFCLRRVPFCWQSFFLSPTAYFLPPVGNFLSLLKESYPPEA